ncbi:MAG: hypothetical protein HY707_11210 [Ignavibacteriae bacterium]|nr:hypothetical protein [Ignavibacteriota bacterium]
MKALAPIQSGSKEARVFLSQICRHYGISRQSHDQWIQAEDSRMLQEEIMLQ